MADQQEEPKMGEACFTKKQILAARQYADQKDLLSVLLRDDEICTLAEVNRRIHSFEKGKVK